MDFPGDPIDITREALLQVLRERSPTWEQGSDVGHIALELGRELGLDDERLQAMFNAAELHGIGKVAVPDAVLNKQGALDEAEWAVMRTHVEAAGRILAVVPQFERAAHLVQAIYERWDGTGYPNGLAGEDIPLEARIVHVCVAFHAMTVARPYRAAMPMDEALDRLEAGAGTQFDPAVVAQLLSLIRAMSG